MAINTDTRKGTGKFSNFLQKTTEVGKSAAESVQKSAAAFSEKVKEDSYQHRLNKYNPLFSDEYFAAEFVLPHLIVIVDEAVRRGIDVCEGAIGWLGKENDVEILYLYDEAVPFSGLQFIPTATCDAVYYVDSFDRHSFIKADCYFRKVQDDLYKCG